MRRRGRVARGKQQRDQRNDKRRRAGEGDAVDRAILVLAFLAVTGDRRAVGIAEADLETRRARTHGKLRRDRAGEHGMEHERIGRDPADQPARQA